MGRQEIGRPVVGGPGIERYGMERYGMERPGIERLGIERTGMKIERPLFHEIRPRPLDDFRIPSRLAEAGRPIYESDIRGGGRPHPPYERR